MTQVTSRVGPVEVSGRAGDTTGQPGGALGGEGIGDAAGAALAWGGSALPAPCPAQGLPVPQVTRLETLLKFGLWLFGVPWANSECCPHPVPSPRCPGVTPFTSCSPHRAAPDWCPPAQPAWPPPAQPPAFAAGGGCHHCPLTPLPLLSPVPPCPPSHPDSPQGFMLIATDLQHQT